MIDNLNDLKYFLEVGKTQNITRAAERLGITQPSLTLAIRRLEEKSGIVLIERSTKGVHLTMKGAELLHAGARMIQEWERETRIIAQGQETPIGRYTLGIHVSAAQYILGTFLPQMLESFPELEMTLIHDLSRKITEKVISRECDLGLVINPIPHPDLVIQKVLKDEVTLFKHPKYEGSVLILDPALKQSQNLLKNLRKFFPFKREVYSSSLEVIRTICENKGGVAILPTRVAEISSLIKKVPGAPGFKDELCLVYRMERKREKSFNELTKAIMFKR
jgi:DNA-binding transcriptional LysR family regulator